MSNIHSYKRLNKLIQNESFEPMISWGLRMAISATLPVVWGATTGRVSDGIWMTLTAEAITWVELKGSFAWRARTLAMGAFLAITFVMLGSVSGNSVWLSVVCMLGVGFLATLLKSIGDRASGLGLCVYLMFIISNAYPVKDIPALHHRFALVAVGAAWPVLVGIGISIIMPVGKPFRRHVALLWRSVSELAGAVSQAATGRQEQVYTKEKEVRVALNNSYQFYASMAYQADKKNNTDYQLTLLRKTAALVSVNIIAMGEQLEMLSMPDSADPLRIKTSTLMNILREAVNRISIFVITFKPEEKLLAVSHINRMKKINELIKHYPHVPGEELQAAAIARFSQLAGRTIKLLANAIHHMDKVGKDLPVYRSYSYIKTALVLRPSYLWRNLQALFNLSTLTTRYALRATIAATLGLLIYKWYGIAHGYWLPFSVMIIIQPYFGATLKKSLDRIAGTLLGGLTGSLLLYLPIGLHIKEAILFLTFILMVYYIRKQYAVAAFAITLNLVLLFNIESDYNNTVLITRAICTAGGAVLAIISGFVLLPSWDRKWLPMHLTSAICCNYLYFTNTFFSDNPIPDWTKLKRPAETKNSDVFDSFNRYVGEPGNERTEAYYSLITTNVRITRNLNNIHLEQEEKKKTPQIPATAAQQQRINECLEYFNAVVHELPALNPAIQVKLTSINKLYVSPFLLNEAQSLSLEKIIIELKTMREDVERMAGGK